MYFETTGIPETRGLSFYSPAYRFSRKTVVTTCPSCKAFVEAVSREETGASTNVYSRHGETDQWEYKVQLRCRRSH